LVLNLETPSLNAERQICIASEHHPLSARFRRRASICARGDHEQRHGRPASCRWRSWCRWAVGVRGGEDVRSGTIVCAQWLGTTTFGHGSDEDGTAWE
jgi:hypothetical protein